MICFCSWGGLGWNTGHEEWGEERESGRTVGCLLRDVGKGPAWPLGTSDLEHVVTLWEPWFLHLYNRMRLPCQGVVWVEGHRAGVHPIADSCVIPQGSGPWQGCLLGHIKIPPTCISQDISYERGAS